MSTTATSNGTDQLISQIQMSGGLVLKDLSAMPHDMLATHQGGKARTGYDMVYELAMINKFIAAQAKGLAGTPPEFTGFPRAPENYQNKDVAMKDFQESFEHAATA